MQLPTADKLKSLREALGKQTPPRIHDRMWCSEPGIGGMQVTAVDADFRVKWVSFEGSVRSELREALWSELCFDPRLEMQRLEIGYVVAEILEVQGQRVMDSIGHPIDSLRESEPYREDARRWRNWAVVKANQMRRGTRRIASRRRSAG
jgi:hypothetical protein